MRRGRSAMTSSANDKPDEPQCERDDVRGAGSGHGADSAMNALIKQRVPPPDALPPLPDGDE